MLERLAGGAPVIGPAVSRAIGAQLARLHLVPADGLPPKPHWIEDVYLQRALGEVRERAGDAATAGPRGAFDALGDFDPARLPHSLVHGDLDPSNCLFEGDGLVAFLDWQDVGVGASLLDFAMTILGFCFHEVVEPEWRGTFDPDAYAALYASYSALRTFTDDERAQMDAALRYVGLTQSVWSLLHWDLYNPGEPLDETRTLYCRYGLHTLNVPASKRRGADRTVHVTVRAREPGRSLPVEPGHGASAEMHWTAMARRDP